MLSTHFISSIHLKFFTKEEINKISVVDISEPESFDGLGHPQPNGLYDLRMGPIDRNYSCHTCNQNDQHCPGHAGSINLALPVYHPLLLSKLHRILKGICFCCGRFKISQQESHFFARCFQLIDCGLVTEADNLYSQVAYHLYSSFQDSDTVSATVIKNQSKKPQRFQSSDSSDSSDSSGSDSSGSDSSDSDSESLSEHSTIPAPKRKRPNPQQPKADPAAQPSKFVKRRLFSHQYESPAELIHLIDQKCKEIIDAANQNEIPRYSPHRSSFVLENRKKLVSQVIDRITSRTRCENCRGYSPSISLIRNDTLVVEPLGPRQYSFNKNQLEFDVFSRFALFQRSSKDIPKKFQFLSPHQTLDLFNSISQKEENLCAHLFGRIISKPKPSPNFFSLKLYYKRQPQHSMFFLDCLYVAPNRYRPLNFVSERKMENPINSWYTKILRANQNLISTIGGNNQSLDDAQTEEILKTWVMISQFVAGLIDTDKYPYSTDKTPVGIRQHLEKKQGLIRKSIMGKRVNYSGRCVINPDPYLDTSEIGVPFDFAFGLTFPEPVNSHNIDRLRKAIINGPKLHPGAVGFSDEHGTYYSLDRKTKEQRTLIADQLETSVSALYGMGNIAQKKSKLKAVGKMQAHLSKKNLNSSSSSDDDEEESQIMSPFTATSEILSITQQVLPPFQSVKVVHRHLVNGDVLLLNRQPTLHRNSILAHRARIIDNKKTMRLHYANCKGFNADFDGDEMNVHFPQDLMAQTEARELMDADLQYTDSADGMPIRGLIQDHIVSGILLTTRDRFLDRTSIEQLIFGALCVSEFTKKQIRQGKETWGRILLPQPAILKPKCLWTGKQVVSAILGVLLDHETPFSLESKSKISEDTYPVKIDPVIEQGDESQVIILNNQLLCGILDKSQFGATPYGLLHATAFLYGNKFAGSLLTILSRLFTLFLKSHGLTLSLSDLVLKSPTEKVRNEILHTTTEITYKSTLPLVASYLKKNHAPHTWENFSQESSENQQEFLQQAIQDYIETDETAEAKLDRILTGELSKVTGQVIKACIPKNLVKPFPFNKMLLMVLGGAKGSLVNISQIACCLGQQELEGRRVPRMPSGQTMPWFPPYDPRPSAGGYVSGRFYSGLEPHEYIFHCMAGREGLIDTAVKTAASGYLQRCLIKAMENIVVGYDGTVRNTDDGSIVQFIYGEDGIDVRNSAWMSKLGIIEQNFRVFVEKYKDFFSCLESSRQITSIDKISLTNLSDPVISYLNPYKVLGCVSEKYQHQVESIIEKAFDSGDSVVDDSGDSVPGDSSDDSSSDSSADSDSDSDGFNYNEEEEKSGNSTSNLKKNEKLVASVYHRFYQTSLVEPGEPVGIVAAQSIGQPSTQMTLNTFHLAGFGGMNVTLGIPRLRELLMMASNSPSTPLMTLPVKPSITHEQIGTICSKVVPVPLNSLMKSIHISESFDYAVLPEDPMYEVSTNSIYKSWPFESGSKSRKRSRQGESLNFLHKPMISRIYHVSLLLKSFSAIQRFYSHLSQNDMIEWVYTTFCPSILKKLGKFIAECQKRDSVVLIGEEDSQKDGIEADFLDDIDEIEESSDDDGDDGDDGDDSQSSPPDTSTPKTKSKSKTKSKTKSKSETQKQLRFSPKEINEKYNALYKFFAHIDLKTTNHFEIIFTFQQPFNAPHINFDYFFRENIPDFLVTSILNLTGARIKERKQSEIQNNISQDIITSGINMNYVIENLEEFIDLNSIRCNNIHTIAEIYGIEAARGAIIHEVNQVFGAYGIKVDYRHLSLISEVMTCTGKYNGFNRVGSISNSVSPLLKSSFETSVSFLVEAGVNSEYDNLTNPSAAITMGSNGFKLGTQSFDLFVNPTAFG